MINVTGIVDALPLGSTDSLVSNFFESCGAVVGQVPIIRRNTKGGLQPDHRTNRVRGLLPLCRPSWSYRVAKSYYLLTRAFFDNQKQLGASETYCHFDSRHRLEGLPTAGGWCGLDRSHVTAVARSC